MDKKDYCGQRTQVRHIFSPKASLCIIFICVYLSQTKLSSLSELARKGILLVQPQTKLGNLLFQLPSISQREILFAFPEISIWISQSFQQDFAALIISLVFPHYSMQGYQDLNFCDLIPASMYVVRHVKDIIGILGQQLKDRS